MNINGARGTNSKINDRFDLTLECIRRYYFRKESPLQEVLLRYSDFFELFENFKGYVDFFLLQDLVSNNYETINFYLPFDNFKFLKHALEWNVFLGVIIFYLLTHLMWKKTNS